MQEQNTPQRIAAAALKHFLSQGIKKTSMEEIAAEAGLTRMTVYRSYPDKQALTAAAFECINQVLDDVLADLQNARLGGVSSVLESLSAGMSSLPQGDLPSRLDELHKVYPNVWEAYHNRRKELIGSIFKILFSQARQSGRLREGLNQEVIQAYFMSAVVDVLQNPALISSELSAAELLETVKNIFLFGILKEEN